MVGIAAQQKSEQLASKDRSDFEGMVILPAKFSELSKVDPRKRSQQVPRSCTRLPALPKTRTQATEPQSITRKEQAT